MKKKKAMEKLFDFFCVEILICLIRPQSRSTGCWVVAEGHVLLLDGICHKESAARIPLVTSVFPQSPVVCIEDADSSANTLQLLTKQ